MIEEAAAKEGVPQNPRAKMLKAGVCGRKLQPSFVPKENHSIACTQNNACN